MDVLLPETKTDPTYFDFFFQKLKQMKSRKHFCDIQIVAKYNGNTEVRYFAHKIVLASGSVYFAAHIDEIKKDILELDLRDDKSEDFLEILNYLYTGKISCKISNVIFLYKYAEKFEMESLKFVLIEFMKNHVTSYTWLNFWRFGDSIAEFDLSEECENFCRKNLEDSVYKNLENLKAAELKKILKGFKVNSKEQHFKIIECIIKWIQINKEERFEYLFELTEWSSSLMISAIARFHNEGSKLKAFITSLTFNKVKELFWNEATNLDTKIKYTFIKEWAKINDRKPYQKFEELLRKIDLKKLDIEDLKIEMSVEPLICENQIIQLYMKSSIEKLLEDPLNKNVIQLKPTEVNNDSLIREKDLFLLKIVKLFDAHTNLPFERIIAFKHILNWIKINEEERYKFLFELTQWNRSLMESAILHLYSNQRSLLKDFLTNMTFERICQFISYTKIHPQDLYTLIKEWIYLPENEPSRNKRFVDLILSINLERVDVEFLKSEMKNERLLCGNPDVKRRFASIINP